MILPLFIIGLISLVITLVVKYKYNNVFTDYFIYLFLFLVILGLSLNNKGSQGEKGEVGPQGEHGEQGEQGIQGERGEVGPSVVFKKLPEGRYKVSYNDGKFVYCMFSHNVSKALMLNSCDTKSVDFTLLETWEYKKVGDVFSLIPIDDKDVCLTFVNKQKGCNPLNPESYACLKPVGVVPNPTVGSSSQNVDVYCLGNSFWCCIINHDSSDVVVPDPSGRFSCPGFLEKSMNLAREDIDLQKLCGWNFTKM